MLIQLLNVIPNVGEKADVQASDDMTDLESTQTASHVDHPTHAGTFTWRAYIGPS